MRVYRGPTGLGDKGEIDCGSATGRDTSGLILDLLVYPGTKAVPCRAHGGDIRRVAIAQQCDEITTVCRIAIATPVPTRPRCVAPFDHDNVIGLSIRDLRIWRLLTANA